MMFKSSRRIVLFTLLCSIAAIPNATLRADTAQDCAKSKKIVQRVHGLVCKFMTSGNPKLVVGTQTYLSNLKPSATIVKTLVNKLMASTTALLEKMREASKMFLISNVKSSIVPAFAKFGDDVENIARDVRKIGAAPEIQDLGALLEKLPEEINEKLLKLKPTEKVKLAVKMASQIWLKKF